MRCSLHIRLWRVGIDTYTHSDDWAAGDLYAPNFFLLSRRLRLRSQIDARAIEGFRIGIVC